MSCSVFQNWKRRATPDLSHVFYSIRSNKTMLVVGVKLKSSSVQLEEFLFLFSLRSLATMILTHGVLEEDEHKLITILQTMISLSQTQSLPREEKQPRNRRQQFLLEVSMANQQGKAFKHCNLAQRLLF